MSTIDNAINILTEIKESTKGDVAAPRIVLVVQEDEDAQIVDKIQVDHCHKITEALTDKGSDNIITLDEMESPNV